MKVRWVPYADVVDGVLSGRRRNPSLVLGILGCPHADRVPLDATPARSSRAPTRRRSGILTRMAGDEGANAKSVRALIGEAMEPKGLERLGRSRWVCTSPEVLWVIEADRGGSWGRWTVKVGAVVRGWARALVKPHASDGHFYQADYVYLTSAVPAAAEGTRFDDHASYFTRAFDHSSNIEICERVAALQFMAEDVVSLCRSAATLDELAKVVASGTASGFVQRQLREFIDNR